MARPTVISESLNVGTTRGQAGTPSLRASRLRPWLPAIALFLADQALKGWMSATFPLLRRREFLGQTLLVLARVHNRGLMGDRFSGIPKGHIESYTEHLPALCLLAFLLSFRALWPRPRAPHRAFSALLVGGGLSNLLDHVRQGHVVDTLQLLMPDGRYLPFNLADASIVAGVAGISLLLARELSTAGASGR